MGTDGSIRVIDHGLGSTRSSSHLRREPREVLEPRHGCALRRGDVDSGGSEPTSGNALTIATPPAWVAVDVPLCSTRRSGARASAPSAAFGEAIEHGDDVDRDPRSVALLTFGLQQHAGVFELADRVEGRLFGDVKAFLDDGRVDRRLPGREAR